MAKKTKSPVAVEQIDGMIRTIRGMRVMLDRDLAQISALTNRRDQIILGAVSASEIIKELPKLSNAERRAILDKLRELARVDDDRWEEIINDPTPRPKLRAFIEEATAEGSEPLDLNRM